MRLLEPITRKVEPEGQAPIWAVAQKASFDLLVAGDLFARTRPQPAKDILRSPLRRDRGEHGSVLKH